MFYPAFLGFVSRLSAHIYFWPLCFIKCDSFANWMVFGISGESLLSWRSQRMQQCRSPDRTSNRQRSEDEKWIALRHQIAAFERAEILGSALIDRPYWSLVPGKQSPSISRD
jgi:hypothetical protein